MGSGNSKLSEELYNDGITDITCIDLSAVAVEKMQRRLHLKGMKGELIIIVRLFFFHFLCDGIFFPGLRGFSSVWIKNQSLWECVIFQ